MSSGGWPFPRPPGMPTPGSSSNNNQPQPPKGPLGPQNNPGKYSWSDRIYMNIVRYGLKAHVRDPLPKETIYKIQHGHLDGVSEDELETFRAHYADRFLRGRGPELKRDLEAYSNGQALSESDLKRLVFYRSGVIGVQMTVLLSIGWGIGKIAYRGLRRFGLIRNPEPRGQAEGQPGAPPRSRISQAGPGSHVDAQAFYGRAIYNPNERVGQLVEREIYLRGIFNQK